MRTNTVLAPLLVLATAMLNAVAQAASAEPVSFPVTVERGEGSVQARWTGPVAVGRERGGTGSALKVGRTRYGAFAEGSLVASRAWAEAEAIEIEVEVVTHGVFSAKLIEQDGDGLEGWTLQADLEPGVHLLRRRLRSVPEGDLRSATPVGDGAWNPGDGGVRRIRLGFSGDGMSIRAVRLRAAAR